MTFQQIGHVGHTLICWAWPPRSRVVGVRKFDIAPPRVRQLGPLILITVADERGRFLIEIDHDPGGRA